MTMPRKQRPPRASLRSRWLGEHMRRLRTQRGMTLRYAAAQLGVDSAVTGRFERGEELFGLDRVSALLDLYLVFDQGECDRLLCLARDVWHPPVTVAFDERSHDPSVVDVLWLERRAERIRCYSTALVPELLQITAYAEAAIRAERPGTDDDDIARQISVLTQRQAILQSATPARLQMVLAECVLRRPVGHADALDDQLRQLAAAADGRVEVRVLPASAGYLPGMASPFTLFDLPAPYPTVASVPYVGGRLLLEGGDAEPYAAAFERLHTAATTPALSPNL